MLRLRRMTMAFSQVSQHGESAALADLFAHDAAGEYAHAIIHGPVLTT